MLPQSTLETARLILRPLSLADAPLLQGAAGAREVADTMISIPHPYPDGEAKQYIQRQIQNFKAGYAVSFVIERKADCSKYGLNLKVDLRRAIGSISWLCF